MKEEKLLELKKKIEDAKTQINKLTGKKEHLMSELQTKFGCATIAEAEEKLDELEEKEKALQVKIDNALRDLNEKYNNVTD